MKRMIAFLFILPVLFFISLEKSEALPNIDYERVVIITKSEHLIEEGDVIQNGQDYYFTLDRAAGEQILNNLPKNQIEGLVYFVSLDYSLDYFKNLYGSNLTSQSEAGGREIYYGYDCSYSNVRYVDGKKINVQIAKTDEFWVVGYPMILTGF